VGQTNGQQKTPSSPTQAIKKFEILEKLAVQQENKEETEAKRRRKRNQANSSSRIINGIFELLEQNAWETTA